MAPDFQTGEFSGFGFNVGSKPCPCSLLNIQFCVSPGKKLAQMLGVKNLPAAMIQLYVAFFISAIIHSLGDLMVGPKYLGASLLFFGSQPVAITIEELVKFILRRYIVGSGAVLGLDATAARVLGYVWVIWWLTFSGPWLLDSAVRAGFDKDRLFPFSPTHYTLTLFSVDASD